MWGKQCEPGRWRLRYGVCLLAMLGEGSAKKQWPLPALVSVRKPPPAALALMPDNSVLPHMSLMPFNLLTPLWGSEGESPSKSVHGPFKRNCLGLQKLMSSSVSIPTGCYSQKLWGLFFWALEPWVGWRGVGLGPLSPQGVLHKQHIPPNFHSPYLGVGPAHSAAPPLLPVSMWFILTFHSYRSSI